MDTALEVLLNAAARAPSGDNTQPWHWVVDADAGLLTLYLDETRDPSPMNAGQRMARMALGAALENLDRMATRLGAEVHIEEPPSGATAALRLTGLSERNISSDQVIPARVTNRRLYDGRPVPSELLATLCNATPQRDGVVTHWITARERLKVLADIAARADAMMFAEPSMRRAFLANVRFDMPAATEVEEGLSLASLELSIFDRLAMPLLHWMPRWLFRYGGAAASFATRARRSMLSASGVCLVVAPDESPQTDLAAGRALQQAWLTLTEQGLATQPMMAPLILENTLDNGATSLIAAFGHRELEAARRELRSALPEIGAGRPAFLLRFGWASPPSGRVGRRPVTIVSKREPLAVHDHV